MERSNRIIIDALDASLEVRGLDGHFIIRRNYEPVRFNIKRFTMELIWHIPGRNKVILTAQVNSTADSAHIEDGYDECCKQLLYLILNEDIWSSISTSPR